MLILGKNISNFVSPRLKTTQPVLVQILLLHPVVTEQTTIIPLINYLVPWTSSEVLKFDNADKMKKGRKMKITGQAFGVGAYEEEDEDIYNRDDMSRYDFSLGNDGEFFC